MYNVSFSVYFFISLAQLIKLVKSCPPCVCQPRWPRSYSLHITTCNPAWDLGVSLTKFPPKNSSALTFLSSPKHFTPRAICPQNYFHLPICILASRVSACGRLVYSHHTGSKFYTAVWTILFYVLACLLVIWWSIPRHSGLCVYVFE